MRPHHHHPIFHKTVFFTHTITDGWCPELRALITRNYAIAPASSIAAKKSSRAVLHEKAQQQQDAQVEPMFDDGARPNDNYEGFNVDGDVPAFNAMDISALNAETSAFDGGDASTTHMSLGNVSAVNASSLHGQHGGATHATPDPLAGGFHASVVPKYSMHTPSRPDIEAHLFIVSLVCCQNDDSCSARSTWWCHPRNFRSSRKRFSCFRGS